MPTPGASETVPLAGSDDVVRARHRVRALAIELGFDLVAQTRIVTATSIRAMARSETSVVAAPRA